MLKARKSSLAQGGQAIVEYLIMITVAIALVSVFGSGMRNALGRLWSYYTQSVSAGCPTGCPSETKYRLR